jgi:hypothetical protein
MFTPVKLNSPRGIYDQQNSFYDTKDSTCTIYSHDNYSQEIKSGNPSVNLVSRSNIRPENIPSLN